MGLPRYLSDREKRITNLLFGENDGVTLTRRDADALFEIGRLFEIHEKTKENVTAGRYRDITKYAVRYDVTDVVYQEKGPGENRPGVYFLIRQNKIVYVGQSRDVYSRVQSHRAERRIEFDRFKFLDVAVADLNTVERFYIAKFDPEYNRTKPREGSVPLSDVYQKDGVLYGTVARRPTQMTAVNTSSRQ